MKLQNRLFYSGLLLLIAVSVTIHWQWFVRPGIFTSGDWWYVPNQFFLESLTTPKILDGFANFTAGSPTPTFTPLFLLGGLLALVTHAFPLWERLFFLWPIGLIGIIPMYILLYRKYLAVVPAIGGALVYACNSYILIREAGHLYIAIAYLIFAPLLCIVLDQLLRKPSLKNGFFFTITMIGFSIYEIRILYIFSLILIAYVLFLYTTKQIRLSRKILITGSISATIIVLAQSYWLIPFIFSHSSLGYATFVSRGLFQSFATLFHAFALSDPNWTGNGIADFTTQPLPIIAYGIPLLAFCWIIAKQRKEKSGDLWFWTAVACIGIFLTKQASPPFPNAYQWIFEHVPGFQLFRDASKFYLYIGFAYAILTSATLSFLQKRRASYIIAPIILIGAITLANALPFIRNKVQNLTKPYDIQKQFLALQDLLEQDISFGRTLWVPSTDRFNFVSQTHPRVNANDVLEHEWKKIVQNQKDPYSLFSLTNSKKLLDFGSIAYIGTPMDATNEMYRWYSRTQNNFSSIIEKIPNLTRITQTETSIPLWKNNDAKSHIYISNNITIADGTISDYPEIVEEKNSAVIFKSDISPDKYFSLGKSIIANWNIKPFTLENITVRDNQLQTTAQLPKYTNLTTTDKNIGIDINEEIYVQIINKNIEIFTKQNNNKNILATFPSTDDELFININGKTFSGIHPTSEELVFGVARIKPTENQIAIYQKLEPTKPLIENPSFEQESWGTVGDCNNTDGSPVETNNISSSLFNDATNGIHALRLSAGSHIGCVQARITRIKEASLYTVIFDYKHLQGDPGVVKIHSSAPFAPAIASLELGISKEWHQKQLYFSNLHTDNAPFNLFLYQPGSIENGNRSESLFDNFDIKAYQLIIEKKFDTNSIKESTSKPFELSDILIQPSHAYRTDNVINDELFDNNSTYKVGDCANVDNSSVEENGISAHIEEENGMQTLILEAKQHLACVQLTTGLIDPTHDYLLSLRYKIIHGTSPAIALYPNIPGHLELPVYNDSEWHTFKKIITGNTLDNNTKLFLYTSTNSSPSKVAFSDIQMTAIPILPQREITTAQSSLPLLQETVQTINPTLHIIHTNYLDTSRLLVLSDRFDAGWRLFVRPAGTKNLSWWQRILGRQYGTQISANNHLKVNVFVNGWIIDPVEIQTRIGTLQNIEFVIEYWPQRFMDIGITISLVTLLTAGACILVIMVVKRIII